MVYARSTSKLPANAGSIEMVEASSKADRELRAAELRLNEAKQTWDEAEEALEQASKHGEQATDALEGLRKERDLRKEAHREVESKHAAAKRDAVQKNEEASSIQRKVRCDALTIAEREETHAVQQVRLKQAVLEGFKSGMTDEAKEVKKQLLRIAGPWQIIITVTAAAVVLAGEMLYYAHFDTNVFDHYSMNSLSAVVDAVYIVTVAAISVVVTYLLVHVIVRGGVWGINCWISTRGAFRVGAARARTVVLRIFFATFGRLAGLLQYVLRKALENGDADYKVPEAREEEDFWRDKRTEEERGKTAALISFERVRAAAMTLSIMAVAGFVMLFEPRYRAHTICTGTRSIGIVVEPALGKRSEFIRIGSMGGYVFAMPPIEFVGPVAPKNERTPPNRREKNLKTVIRDGYRQVRAALVRRAQFLTSQHLVGGIPCPVDVVAVPQNRVLCVHDRLVANGFDVCVPAAEGPDETIGAADAAGAGTTPAGNGAEPTDERQDGTSSAGEPSSRTRASAGEGAGRTRGDPGQAGETVLNGGRPERSSAAAGQSSPRMRGGGPESPEVFRVLYLRNGVLEGENRGVGIEVRGQERLHLHALRDALAACAAEEENLTMEVRGFASSAPFNERTVNGLRRVQDSDSRNLDVANQRAVAVAEILAADGSGLDIETMAWKSFDAMRSAIKFKDRDEDDVPTDREYLNRSVEISLENLGECAVTGSG